MQKSVYISRILCEVSSVRNAYMVRKLNALYVQRKITRASIVIAIRWSRFIVLKSSEGGIPFTKLSPFANKKLVTKAIGRSENLQKKQHAVYIFINLEKAFDTT